MRFALTGHRPAIQFRTIWRLAFLVHAIWRIWVAPLMLALFLALGLLRACLTLPLRT